ncbi:MAG TPA: fused MFS/spermidine synthase, partial [bacterium]|nr:fused MFS/spermidine synthase [bacterium]
GMVSPFAIRIQASSLSHVGRTAGNLYAVSTVASVASALAMGFFLIPEVGVARLTFGTGIALVITALLAFAGGGLGARRFGGAAVVLLAAASLGLARVPTREASPELGLLDVRQSAYAELRVLETRNARHLLVDGSIHTIVDLDDGRSWHRYTVATELVGLHFDEPGSVLLVGLGGGALARQFRRDGWSVTAVEIDPEVVAVAREWFDFTDRDAEVHVMDGRRFLNRTADRYDLIVVDAFGSSSIPFHLATTEAFAVMEARLAPGGILAMNVETVGWEDPLLSALAASLAPHFESVTAFPTGEPPDALGNVILAAWNGERPFDEYEKLPRPFELLAEPHRHWWAVQLSHAWDNRFTPEIAGVAPLTDDRNPLDLWSERINLEARRELHDYFGTPGTSW